MTARRRPRLGAIDVVEALYDVSGDEPTWLRRIVDAIQPTFDDGFGIMACSYDLRDPAKPRFGPFAAVGQVAEDQAVSFRVAQALGPEVAMRAIGRTGSVGAAEFFGMTTRQMLEHPAFKENWHPRGYQDFHAINAGDPGLVGLYVGAPRRRPFRQTGPTREIWDRVAAHLAAASRLRRAMLDAGGEVAAVLATNGRVEHAEADAKSVDARRALRTAAIAIDRARGSLRRTDPAGAAELWRPLVSGRWTILDRFESDGRRYLVARVNEPDTPSPTALQPAERRAVAFAAMGHTNKWIGWELGLSTSRIGGLIASAARKLRVKSRTDLVDLVQRMGALAPR